ncbi:MAG: FecR domain-containing protein [Colwellia sp.]
MSLFEQVTQNVSDLKSQTWDWVIRLDGDEPLTAKEKVALKAWLAESPDRMAEIYRLNKLWHKILLSELMDLTENKALQREELAKTRIKTAILKPTLAFASTCLLVIGVQSWWSKSLVPESYTNTMFSTAIGEQQIFALSDGSNLMLDSGSQVKVAYSDSSRELWLLQGEAHFEVATNIQRPFNVYALNGRIQAVGTAFNVSLNNSNQLEVLVTEGKVALALALTKSLSNEPKQTNQPNQINLAPLQDITHMNAGEFTRIDSTTSFQQAKNQALTELKTLSANEMLAEQAWRQGELIFTGETLLQVVEKLKRYSLLDIEIVDSELEQLKIGGRFELTQIDQWLKSLEHNFGLQVEQVTDNKILIRVKMPNL